MSIFEEYGAFKKNSAVVFFFTSLSEQRSRNLVMIAETNNAKDSDK